MASVYKDPSSYVIIPPTKQLFLMAASLTILAAALVYNLYVFKTNDFHEPLKTLSHQKISQWNAQPKTIKTGLYIREFQKFDFSSNQFIMKGTVWFELPKDSDIDIKKLSDFEFEKATTTMSGPVIKMLQDGNTLVQFNVTVQLASPMNHRQFPLDDHRLFLVMIHNSFQPKDIQFEATINDFSIAPEVKIPGWRNVGQHVHTGYLKTPFSKQSVDRSRHYCAALYQINYARNANRLLISILLPLLLLFFLSMFSFSVHYKLCMTIATAAITAILGYRFVIERLSPDAARDYFTFSDYFFLIYFIAVSLVFIIIAYDLFAESLSAKIKTSLCYLFYIITSFFCVYLLTVWQ